MAGMTLLVGVYMALGSTCVWGKGGAISESERGRRTWEVRESFEI